MSRGRLAVFAKAPQPGRVKTRLVPTLTPEQAAGLYDAMLADVLAASLGFARRLELEPVLYFDPPEERDAFAARAPAAFALEPQRGFGLAERMANAFTDSARRGSACLLLRGSDSPGLALEPVADALARLEAGADLVLTPDQGGGYALIGMKMPRPELFEVALSTRSVLSETLDRARALGLAAELTTASFDVDVAADLAHVDALPASTSSGLCPRTVGCLASLRQIGVL